MYMHVCVFEFSSRCYSCYQILLACQVPQQAQYCTLIALVGICFVYCICVIAYSLMLMTTAHEEPGGGQDGGCVDEVTQQTLSKWDMLVHKQTNS